MEECLVRLFLRTIRDTIALLSAVSIGKSNNYVRPEDMGNLSSNTVFWRVSVGDKDSWMLGTIHAGRWRGVELPSLIAEVLQSSDVVFTESAVEASEQASMIAKTLLPQGARLQELIGKERFDVLLELVRQLRIPVAAEIIDRHDLWFAILLLSTPPAVDSAEAPLDLVLHEMAASSGKPIRHLENPEEHMSVLGRFTFEESLAILDETMDALRNDGPVFFRNLLELYGEGRISEIVKLMDCRHSTKLRRKFRSIMLHERNELFADRLLPYFEKGGVFASFGAAHLPGVKGVVGLLRRKGLAVKPVRIEMPSITGEAARE